MLCKRRKRMCEAPEKQVEESALPAWHNSRGLLSGAGAWRGVKDRQ